MTHKYLSTTKLLDYTSPAIVRLIAEHGWNELDTFARIGAIYDFVRNQIAFGYNRADDISASQVLEDGYGQCNTKGTLLMALFRACGVKTRLHGFTIDKSLQRGVVPEIAYKIAPNNIVHSWVEIKYQGKWLNLEGFILDDGFLTALQAKFPGKQSLCAYGAGTDCLQNPDVKWEGRDTYIQKTGINQDFGVFDTPDVFFQAHQQEFGFFRALLYRGFVRHWMNVRVKRIRKGFLPSIPKAELSTRRAY